MNTSPYSAAFNRLNNVVFGDGDIGYPAVMIVYFITLEYSIFKVIDVLCIFCSVQWDQDSLSALGFSPQRSQRCKHRIGFSVYSVVNGILVFSESLISCGIFQGRTSYEKD